MSKKTYTPQQAADLLAEEIAEELLMDPDSADDCLDSSDEEEEESNEEKEESEVHLDEDYNLSQFYGN